VRILEQAKTEAERLTFKSAEEKPTR
jgi:hypothetical protein